MTGSALDQAVIRIRTAHPTEARTVTRTVVAAYAGLPLCEPDRPRGGKLIVKPHIRLYLRY